MMNGQTVANGGVAMHEPRWAGPARDRASTAASGLGLPPLPRRIDAVLVYDSRDGSPMMGVRMVGSGFPRLMYRAYGYEVDLQVRPGARADRLRVLGRVLDDAFEPGAGWVVIAGVDGVLETTLDTCGHFSIDGLVAGRHRIELGLPVATIEIPSVHL